MKNVNTEFDAVQDAALTGAPLDCNIATFWVRNFHTMSWTRHATCHKDASGPYSQELFKTYPYCLFVESDEEPNIKSFYL